MEIIPKAEAAEIFKKLCSKRENKLCFDCSAKSPSWATVSFGVFLCLECSAVHRNMGVHLTFVRSTNLDAWNIDQLRAMKVGGNANAADFFSKHLVNVTNAKERYSSKAGSLYKERLRKLVEQDAKLYPHKIVLESDAPVVEPVQEDFFSDWGGADVEIPPLKSASPALSQTATPARFPSPVQKTESPVKVVPVQRTESPVKTVPVQKTESPKKPVEQVIEKMANVSITGSIGAIPATNEKVGDSKFASIVQPTPIVAQAIVPSSGGSSILKPVKRGLGAKKAPKGISFEEAQKRAQEESEKRKAIEAEAERLRIEHEKEAATARAAGVQVGYAPYKAPSPKTSTVAPPAPVRMGFGFDASEAPPPLVAPARQPPSGFGGFGATGSSSQDSSEATKRFGTAKGISSDQYFGRGNYDENANAQAKERLQNFQGRSGFGSEDYYDRDESAESRNSRVSITSNGSVDPALLIEAVSDSAKDFANKFMGQATEDFQNVKKMVTAGGSKLGDLLADIQSRYG